MRGSSLVWDALRRARRLNLAAAGEAPPVPGPAGQSRRDLLKALAAGGAIALLPRPARAAFALRPGGRVAIIGGGIAGLSTLHHLRAAGVDAWLYEARGRLGGRMSTPRSFDGNKPVEDGAQLVNSDHADIRALLDAYDVKLVDRKKGKHRTIVVAGGKAVPEAELVRALQPIARQITADSDRLSADYAAVAPELDALSIRQYLDRHAALMPVPWVRGLLEGTCRSEYGSEPDKASAIELIFNLPTVDGKRVEILGESDERYLIAGGSGTLVERMGKAMADRIATGKRATRIARTADRRLVVAFADGGFEAADAVVVAVPGPLMRAIDYSDLLNDDWRGLVGAVESGRNEKLHVGCAKRVWSTAKGLGVGGELWMTDAAAGFTLGWDGTVVDPAAPAGVFTFFLGGDHVAAAADADMGELAKRFVAAVEPVIPGLTKAMTGVVRRTAWHRDPMALGAYSNYPPGFLTTHGKHLWVEAEDPAEAQTAALGDLVFAGEHMSDAYPGYMNGAAQTGRLSALYLTARAGAAKKAA